MRIGVSSATRLAGHVREEGFEAGLMRLVMSGEGRPLSEVTSGDAAGWMAR